MQRYTNFLYDGALADDVEAGDEIVGGVSNTYPVEVVDLTNICVINVCRKLLNASEIISLDFCEIFPRGNGPTPK